MPLSLDAQQQGGLLAKLATANGQTATDYRGESEARQPVQTVYGGAQLFKRTTTQKIGQLAAQSFSTYGADLERLASELNLGDAAMTQRIHARVTEKLAREAVEDFRIDFEDGFGVRPETEEDETAVFAAQELAASWAEGLMSPFSGIRVKSLGEETKARALRTLDLFLTALVEATQGKVDERFVVTLPKITHRDQVAVFAEALGLLEQKLGVAEGTFKFELMVETPQTIFGADGLVALPAMVRAADGRCIAAHFGTYDYTASMNITAEYQAMDHQACDFARSVMKVALAGTGVWLSDGATNIMPVAPHKSPSNASEEEENRQAIYKAWSLSFAHVSHSLQQGIYQGWDLHPAQLPVRYLALYNFFLRGLDQATERLRHFVDHAAKATLVGDVFDDAATGQGLLNYFLRAHSCGAIDDAELAACGLTPAELATRSFIQIVRGRQA